MAEQVQAENEAAGRKRRKTLIGVVTSDKADKTRRVDVERLSKHPIYGKYLRRRTVCYVHDEKNESKLGDTVEVMESRPMSKTKRWRLVRVVRQAAAEGDGAELQSMPSEAASE